MKIKVFPSFLPSFNYAKVSDTWDAQIKNK
jgi:hypothetical protein